MKVPKPTWAMHLRLPLLTCICHIRLNLLSHAFSRIISKQNCWRENYLYIKVSLKALSYSVGYVSSRNFFPKLAGNIQGSLWLVFPITLLLSQSLPAPHGTGIFPLSDDKSTDSLYFPFCPGCQEVQTGLRAWITLIHRIHIHVSYFPWLFLTSICNLLKF